MDNATPADSEYHVPPYTLRKTAHLAAALHTWHEKQEKAVPKVWWFWRFRDMHLEWDDERDFHHKMAMHFRQLNHYLETCTNRKDAIAPQTWGNVSCGMAAIHAVELGMECTLRELATGSRIATSCINPQNRHD